jgi:hypothetical protein
MRHPIERWSGHERKPDSRTLISGEHPATSWAGIALSTSSSILMPLLGRAKEQLGTRLGSGATAAKALTTCSAPTPPRGC